MKTILIVLFFIGMFVYNVYKSTVAAKKKQSERVSSVEENEQDELFESESKLVHNQGVGRNDFAGRNAFSPDRGGVSSLELESRNRTGFFSHHTTEMESKDTVSDRVASQIQDVNERNSDSFEVFGRDEEHDFDAKRVFELRDAVVYSAILHRPQY